MGSTSELVIVGVVVSVALVWAGRSVWRSLHKTGGCSSCSTSGDCPLVKDPEALINLSDIPTDCEKTTFTESHPR